MGRNCRPSIHLIGHAIKTQIWKTGSTNKLMQVLETYKSLTIAHINKRAVRDTHGICY